MKIAVKKYNIVVTGLSDKVVDGKINMYFIYNNRHYMQPIYCKTMKTAMKRRDILVKAFNEGYWPFVNSVEREFNEMSRSLEGV